MVVVALEGAKLKMMTEQFVQTLKDATEMCETLGVQKEDNIADMLAKGKIKAVAGFRAYWEARFLLGLRKHKDLEVRYAFADQESKERLW